MVKSISIVVRVAQTPLSLVKTNTVHGCVMLMTWPCAVNTPQHGLQVSPGVSVLYLEDLQDGILG